MIGPPSGLSGRNGNPITVRALNDGQALIDGEHARNPVSLSRNSWFVLEGFNAARGDSKVMGIANQSNHNIVRRVVMWDARIDQNNNVFGYHGSAGPVLVEDSAFFGPARKVISNSQGGNNLTLRRVWVRWEGNTYGSPIGMTYIYKSYGARLENVIVTWSGSQMPFKYQLARPDKDTVITNYATDGTRGILGMDRLEGTGDQLIANAKIFGSLVYVKADAKIAHVNDPSVAPPIGFEHKNETAGTEVRHLVVVIDPSHPQFGQRRALQLGNNRTADLLNRAQKATLIASNITTVAGVSNHIQSNGWTVEGTIQHGTSLPPSPSPWTQSGSNGANLCNRWTPNGDAPSDIPLWPWPMNERIRAATAVAGAYSGPCMACQGERARRTATNVTAEIEALLGPIPSQCRG